ncbi:type A chloramphenicol O-acetyltransferase [Brachyspira intermedia]|uniref:type A chloramphenicol O-acetyltransferase n=2 Tax=Brachyspira intermedia TaxID=84377 RepID=UPI0030046CF4
MFNKIDLNNYNRKEHYEMYMNNIPCTYSITVPLNITKFKKTVKDKNIKFYASVIYLISKVVNKYKEFKMALNDNKELGYYDIISPSYTIFHNDTKTFSSIHTEYNEKFDLFYKNYISDMETYGENKTFLAKPCNMKNIFNISSLPLSAFTSFNLNLPNSFEYLAPIFTIGKYYTDDKNNIMMPLCLQIHHSVCDGYHVGIFFEDLQHEFDEFYLLY